MLTTLLIMNKALYYWLSQYVDFESIDIKPTHKELVVDMFISDQCNLTCKHCYLGKTKTNGRNLSIQEWKETIKSLYNEGVRHFHISGKESSLDSRIPSIVSYIKQFDGTYTGLVSNGTGPSSFYYSLINEGIDYLEFSIDGTEDTHNYIRGNNIYKKVINLIESLSQYNKVIDISTCLNKNSLKEYHQLISILSEIGIKKFFSTPFLLSGNGLDFINYSISPSDFDILVEDTFKYLNSSNKDSLIIKYCIPNSNIMDLVNYNGFIKHLLENYLNGNCDLTTHIGKNLIQVSIDFLDIKYLNELSITFDGDVIPCADYIGDNKYSEYCIGNVLRKDISDILHEREYSINKSLKKLQL